MPSPVLCVEVLMCCSARMSSAESCAALLSLIDSCISLSVLLIALYPNLSPVLLYVPQDKFTFPHLPQRYCTEIQTDLVSHLPSLQRYACASPALYQPTLDSAVLDGSLAVLPVKTSVKRTINQQFRPVPCQ